MTTQKQLTILMVDDDPFCIEVTTSLLKLWGYTVHSASSGKAAVEKISSHDIDMIVMDVQMPGGMNGIETAQEITKLKRIPVIYLTSEAESKLVEDAGKGGSFGYVLKPAKPSQLKSAIITGIYRGCEIEKIKKANIDSAAINSAIGVTMEQRQLTYDDALAYLRREARGSNRSILSLSTEIIAMVNKRYSKLFAKKH